MITKADQFDRFEAIGDQDRQEISLSRLTSLLIDPKLIKKPKEEDSNLPSSSYEEESSEYGEESSEYEEESPEYEGTEEFEKETGMRLVRHIIC